MIDQTKLSKIFKQIQSYQNKYIYYKKSKDSLNMVKIMWEIGDFLFRNKISNPHSLGWEAERQKTFIKRPLIFRSYVIRRIWPNKEYLVKDLFGIKSVNSLIELFPFLDQNSKWNLPEHELKRLLNILNTKPTKIFNNELKFLKKTYIGIRNDRRKYLKDYITLKKRFYEFFNRINNIIKESSIENCLCFLEAIGRENIKNFGKLCLYVATQKEIDLKGLTNINSKDNSFNELYNLFLDSVKTKESINRIRRVIDPLDLIKITDICNAIQKENGIQSYRLREGIRINI